MREQLIPLLGQRLAVRGTFAKYGSRPYFRDFREETLLLTDLATLDGQPLTDHLWLLRTQGFAALDLHKGDTVTFSARVAPYTKYQVYRRKNGRLKRVYGIPDYRLNRPTQIRRLAGTPTEGSTQP
jgi:hypothetical protein